MMNFFIGVVGYLILWIAIEYGRKPDSKISFFTKDGIIQMLLVIIATTIIINVDKWFPL
jgi:hypothetical protein